MPLRPVLTADEIEKIPIIKWFFGFPIENYASFGDIYFTNANGEIAGRLPATGKVTKVPKLYSFWVSTPGGAECSSIDYDEPRDLPRDAKKIALINMRAYDDLHAWNASCRHRDDRVELSYMVVLGPPHRDQAGNPLRHVYRGVYLTPEVLNNPRIASDELLRKLRPEPLPSTRPPVL